MVKVFDVSDYFIINAISVDDEQFCAHKLQSLCVYAQCFSIGYTEKPLFKDNIVLHKFDPLDGTPIIPALLKEYPFELDCLSKIDVKDKMLKILRANYNTKDFVAEALKKKTEKFTKSQYIILKTVWDRYGILNNSWLHTQVATDINIDDYDDGDVIPKENIFDDFEGLLLLCMDNEHDITDDLNNYK